MDAKHLKPLELCKMWWIKMVLSWRLCESAIVWMFIDVLRWGFQLRCSLRSHVTCHATDFVQSLESHHRRVLAQESAQLTQPFDVTWPQRILWVCLTICTRLRVTPYACLVERAGVQQIQQVSCCIWLWDPNVIRFIPWCLSFKELCIHHVSKCCS